VPRGAGISNIRKNCPKLILKKALYLSADFKTGGVLKIPAPFLINFQRALKNRA
jgi:hypothetical protein